MTGPCDAVPARFHRFLPDRPPEPAPAEKFDAWLAEQPDDAGRWRVRGSSPPGMRTRLGFFVPLAVLLTVIAALGWRAIG